MRQPPSSDEQKQAHGGSFADGNASVYGNMDNGSEEETKRPDSDIEIQVAKHYWPFEDMADARTLPVPDVLGAKLGKPQYQNVSVDVPLQTKGYINDTFSSATPSLLSMKRKADDASDEQTDNDSESEDTPKMKRFLTEKKMKKMGLRRKRMKQ
ncbi:hypothetical protein QFC24_005297 [Naganishia onofrii]|uniref:Uncharacterized protein n=1 Tax=Naganishia onofrii TaxID=1851511 RepID=A0ACC2X973_9TREE|nr:hypothetical protein QFC24_005297 [Naganishia onofrii]